MRSVCEEGLYRQLVGSEYFVDVDVESFVKLEQLGQIDQPRGVAGCCHYRWCHWCASLNDWRPSKTWLLDGDIWKSLVFRYHAYWIDVMSLL